MDFEFPFTGSLTSTFLDRAGGYAERPPAAFSRTSQGPSLPKKHTRSLSHTHTGSSFLSLSLSLSRSCSLSLSLSHDRSLSHTRAPAPPLTEEAHVVCLFLTYTLVLTLFVSIYCSLALSLFLSVPLPPSCRSFRGQLIGNTAKESSGIITSGRKRPGYSQ